ncbi:MAG TPA: ABC transporter permease [Acidobacteriaceae bacterium]|nr:ABC transporter permease [Acidobacteriaceae bacterium]
MKNFGSRLVPVLRRLRRTPWFTLMTLVTLAAGAGATIAVFSVVESVLLKPLPYPHSDRLVGVWHAAPGLNLDKLNMAPANYFIYRAQNRVFEDIGVYNGDSLSVQGQSTPERVPALDVSDGVLPILGIQPALGRVFSRADDTPGAPLTIMMSYGYWQRRYGGDRNIVGRNIKVDGKLRQVIGILPKSFRFLDWGPQELLVPMQMDRSKTTLGQFNMEGVARLKPGVTIQQANTDIERMLPIVWNSFPPPPGFSLDLFKTAHIAAKVIPLRQDVVGDVGQILWILMGGIGIVLLIACANVANLMLVRAENRHQELAVCAALGAGRGRIAGEFLLESAVIGIAGCALGLGLAWCALRLLVGLAPSGLPRIQDIGIDLPVLGFTAAVALVCSLLFGSIPAMRYAGTRASTGLREGGRALSQGRQRHRTRNALVVVQVSLAFVLLICSGLMLRTFRALTHASAGYDNSAPIQTFTVDVSEADVPDPTQAVRTQQAILDKIAAIPGVTSVAITNSVPMDDNGWTDPVFAQDQNYAAGTMPPLRRFNFVSPGYWKTMGIPMIAGRDYTWEDDFQRLPVAIVSEKVARETWGTPQNALGKMIRVSSKDEWRQVVGVVGDVHADGLDKDSPKLIYWPLLMHHFESSDDNVRRYVKFAVRTPRAGEESLNAEIRRAVWSIDANLPLVDVHTMDYYYAKSMARTQFTLVMLGAAAGMALLLGVVGLYGTIAYSASQRRREIGIRIALGAQRGNITALFVRQGMLVAGIGILCGLGVALAAARLLRTLLFHVATMDPLTYACACAGLVGAAALASYLPTRRTLKVNPVEALRSE